MQVFHNKDRLDVTTSWWRMGSLASSNAKYIQTKDLVFYMLPYKVTNNLHVVLLYYTLIEEYIFCNKSKSVKNPN